MIKIFEKLIDYFSGNSGALRFLKSHSIEDRIIRKCCELKNLPEEEHGAEIYHRWRSIFFEVCRQKGIDHRSAKVLWDELGDVITEDSDAATRLDDFKSDVYAYRDRWTLHRLSVCHAKFYHWLDAMLS